MIVSASAVAKSGRKGMSDKKVTFTNDGKGKPIHKKGASDGVKSQHKGLMTRHKKRKLRKKKSR